MKLLFALMVIALLLCAVHAQVSQSDANVSQNPAALSLALKIYAQVQVNASTPEEAQEYVRTHSVLVIGHDSDMAEQVIVDDLKAANPSMANISEVNDSPATLSDIQSGKYVLVFIVGGPEQNDIASYVESKGFLNESQDFYGELTVKDGKGPDNVVYVTISDKEGYVPDLQRQNVKSSPLSTYMPQQYVPVAATGITLVLLAIVNMVKTVLEFKASDIGRKGKKVGDAPLKVMGIDLAEIAAILGASFILGIAITWQYFANTHDFVYWVVVNTLIALIGAVLHELTHRIFAHIFKIKIEYRFWPEGSILTLLSAYLGNAFSVQAFLLEEIPEDVAKWKIGIMKLAAPIVSACIMVVFALMNHFNPSPLYHIIYTMSALWAMAEMLPFSGLDGKDIKEWNSSVWGFFFLLIGAAYVVVTFLL